MTPIEFSVMVCTFIEHCPCSEESGYRTISHNRLIGGSENSAHVYGLARDFILDTDIDLQRIIAIAMSMGFCGIEWDARNQHLHLDMHPTGRIWHVQIDAHGASVPLVKTV